MQKTLFLQTQVPPSKKSPKKHENISKCIYDDKVHLQLTK
jgi:hypothetical protein